MLTFKEKEIASRIISEAETLDAQTAPEWSAWFLYALGGFLIVAVCLITADSLRADTIQFYADTIRYVLIPGTVIGLFFLLLGAVITHGSQRAEERKIMAGLLKKLMA